MKEYPSIISYKEAPKSVPCIAFDKLDGSNLRFEWQKKQGWFKFGTRHRLFNETDEVFGPAISIFHQKYGQKLYDVIRKEYGWVEKIVAFCEFFGPSSFAGWHDIDERKDLVLFDIFIHKKGLIPPRQFIKIFKDFETPKIIYDGNINSDLINGVKEGSYPVTFEGVVCKGTLKTKKSEELWMCKIKTNAWLARLKEKSDNINLVFTELREQE